MKFKLGFKASCSSMAFIIRKDAYGSVFNLAKAMIKERDFDDDDDELIKKLEKLEKAGMNPDTNLAFTSINYDTFIALIGSDIWVETANNHDHWDTIEKDQWIGEDQEHPIWEMRKDLDFFDVEKGTIIRGRSHGIIPLFKKTIEVLQNQVANGIRK